MTQPNSIAAVAKRLEQSPGTPLSKPLGEFLDAFYGPVDDRAAMIREEPCAAIPRPLLAYLSATVEHLCCLYGLSPPDWVSRPEYFLDSAFYAETLGPTLEAILIAESPTSFRRRFIFTEAEPLRRKYGPRRA
jgi:hypothetical protein